MPKRTSRNGVDVSHADAMAAYLADRDDELLDAVVTAAALVARADGWVDPAERSRLLDFLNNAGLLSVFTRAEILDTFESRVRQLDEPSGARMAADCFARLAGRSPARLVVEAGEHVAAADGHLHPRELQILRLIRVALSPRFLPPRGGSADAIGERA
jgi:tellurite resistance protein